MSGISADDRFNSSSFRGSFYTVLNLDAEQDAAACYSVVILRVGVAASDAYITAYGCGSVAATCGRAAAGYRRKLIGSS